MPAETPVRATRRAHCLCIALALLLAGPALAQPAPGDAPPDLKFSSFFRQPVGPRGLEVSETLRAADGQRVRLVGYMVAQETPTPGRFLLTPRPVHLSEDADDLPPNVVTVLLDESQRGRVVAHQPGLVALVGRLQLGRQDDAPGRASWVRLVLDPQALAGNPAP